MTSQVSLKALDYGSEGTRFGFNIADITSLNFDAQIALVDALQAAVDNVVLGNFSGKSVQAVDVPVGPKSTFPFGQRESKWRVSYTDTVDTLGNGSFEIGMADLALLSPGTGNMDTTAGAGAALVTAIQDVVVSRLGNPVTVDSIVHVGRNI